VAETIQLAQEMVAEFAPEVVEVSPSLEQFNEAGMG